MKAMSYMEIAARMAQIKKDLANQTHPSQGKDFYEYCRLHRELKAMNEAIADHNRNSQRGSYP